MKFTSRVLRYQCTVVLKGVGYAGTSIGMLDGYSGTYVLDGYAGTYVGTHICTLVPTHNNSRVVYMSQSQKSAGNIGCTV